MYLGSFITIGIVAFLGAISPGPDFVMVTRNSLANNRKVGFLTGVGVGAGTSVHIFYTLVGIGVIVSKSIIAYSMVKYLGAAYLIYLGYKSIRSKSVANTLEVTKSKTEMSGFKAFKEGFLCNALNPKATVFFLSIFTQVISPETPLGIQILLGIECSAIITLWFSLVAIIFSNQYLKDKIKAIQHHIEKIMGALLILLGLKIATESRG